MAGIDIERRVQERREQAREHGAQAATHLFRGDYSSAATECHRAHQQTLIADALAIEVYEAQREQN